MTDAQLPRVGGYAGIWHRFKRITLDGATTKCGQEIKDVYNLRFRYDYRTTGPCPKCFPTGLRAVAANLPDQPEFGATGHSLPKRKAERAVADVPPDSDGGDAEPAPKKGSRVRSEEGHVAQLPGEQEDRGPNAEGDLDQTTGQGEPSGEPTERRKQRSNRGRTGS